MVGTDDHLFTSASRVQVTTLLAQAVACELERAVCTPYTRMIDEWHHGLLVCLSVCLVL